MLLRSVCVRRRSRLLLRDDVQPLFSTSVSSNVEFSKKESCSALFFFCIPLTILRLWCTMILKSRLFVNSEYCSPHLSNIAWLFLFVTKKEIIRLNYSPKILRKIISPIHTCNEIRADIFNFISTFAVWLYARNYRITTLVNF